MLRQDPQETGLGTLGSPFHTHLNWGTMVPMDLSCQKLRFRPPVRKPWRLCFQSWMMYMRNTGTQTVPERQNLLLWCWAWWCLSCLFSECILPRPAQPQWHGYGCPIGAFANTEKSNNLTRNTFNKDESSLYFHVCSAVIDFYYFKRV